MRYLIPLLFLLCGSPANAASCGNKNPLIGYDDKAGQWFSVCPMPGPMKIIVNDAPISVGCAHIIKPYSACAVFKADQQGRVACHVYSPPSLMEHELHHCTHGAFHGKLWWPGIRN